MSETDEPLYRRYLAEENAADLEALLARHRDGLLLSSFRSCTAMRTPKNC